jgi:hypothetical protein
VSLYRLALFALLGLIVIPCERSAAQNKLLPLPPRPPVIDQVDVEHLRISAPAATPAADSIWHEAAQATLRAIDDSKRLSPADRARLMKREENKTDHEKFAYRLALLAQLAKHAK